jgi:hypothetical protein
MNERLFRYAVLKNPTKEEREKGARTVVVVPPSDWCLARTEQEVVMKATREIPEEEMKDADRLEVAVSPF